MVLFPLLAVVLVFLWHCPYYFFVIVSRYHQSVFIVISCYFFYLQLLQ